MCTLKDVSIPIYTTILNDDGRYKKGFFDEYSTNQAVELPNSEIQPNIFHISITENSNGAFEHHSESIAFSLFIDYTFQYHKKA